ncbi:MAG: prephenate dehydrogenase/arogenate dehydrogenase family protein [Candidatus Limnocylindrales bacterium]
MEDRAGDRTSDPSHALPDGPGDPPVTRLAILGLGLIGGSIVQALGARRPGEWAITAWSRSPAGPEAAVEAGLIDAIGDDPLVAASAAELIMLAANPTANVELVGRVGPTVAQAGGLMTDVTSVQGPMAIAAADVPGLRMVGGHPLTGREVAGYDAADPALFVDRPWVIVPGTSATQDDIALVERLAIDCGARPVRLEAAAHDAAVALVSHLPLVVAIALVEAAAHAPEWSVARGLAAQGWQDSTRVARGDPSLGAGMLALNAANVAEALRRHRAALDGWQVRLDAMAGSSGGVIDVEGLITELDRVAALARGEGSDGA